MWEAVFVFFNDCDVLWVECGEGSLDVGIAVVNVLFNGAYVGWADRVFSG